MSTDLDPTELARSRGVSYQELLDADTRDVPKTLRMPSPVLGEPRDIPVDYYTSRAIHDVEKEKIWQRCWQMVCRVDDIPEVGDTHVYDIVDKSYLIVRVTPTVIKAYPNACLHRGRQLRDWGGFTEELRCQFHGFCWNLDGSLKEVPCAWDFPSIEPEEFALPEISTGVWGGFVFINPDPKAEPLDTFVGDLTRHFERWPLEDRYVEAHVAKVLRCNWKACQEAFMESFHVWITHPQILLTLGDANSEVDAFGNWSRHISAGLTPSPHLSWEPTEQEIVDSMASTLLGLEPGSLQLPDGMTARSMLGQMTREQMKEVLGDKADELTDSELNDSFLYTLFPNFHPWGAYNRIVYRFRPNGDDHTSSIMEVMYLTPYVGEKPPNASVHWLDADDDWTLATELGMLTRIFQQDTYNLPMVQKGLQTARKPGVTFAYYQESKMRHFYDLYEEHLRRP